MKYYSTKNKSQLVSFRTAVMDGLAKDGGLFMPEEIPQLASSVIADLGNMTLPEIGFEVARHFAGHEITHANLSSLLYEALNFQAPLIDLSEKVKVLELFHGPTLAFKDFGARFMAKMMEHFVQGSGRELNILVATSGDTGSAVASGFYGVGGINVFILYPKGKVSLIQEKQLTTLDKNITALEIEGTFDDCQRLVKNAFVDDDLSARLNLSSANSINIARLIPQIFYYLHAYGSIKDKSKRIVVSVPSGNLGNLTAGLFAKKMGVPLSLFIGATNINDVFTDYINTALFRPRPSEHTLSNAMDVGNPSNLERIVDLYSGDIENIRRDIRSYSFNDEDTRRGIREVYERFRYVIDPHGAVGYLALDYYLKANNNLIGIVVETAHPAKFKDTVEQETGKKIDIPERLAACLHKEKKSVQLDGSFNSLKEYLLGKA